MHSIRLLAALATALAIAAPLGGQTAAHPGGAVRVDVIKQPYKGSRNVPELSMSPDYIHASGLERLLESWGAELVRPVQTVRLTPEEQPEYGEWHRLGLANGHFAEMVSADPSAGVLVLGLEANCSSLLGMLGGLQNPGGGAGPRRVGLVFIDAHGDFNTPETTLSGMLGGMPVAVSVGHALERLRRESGLERPIPVEHVVWAGVRDLDPLERERFAEYGVRQVSVDDIRARSAALRQEIARLSAETDVIYVHVDMDVLDPAEVPGHRLAVPGGPTSQELAAALAEIFRDPKVGALGIASTPAGSDDPTGVSRDAALSLIRGAIEGVRSR